MKRFLTLIIAAILFATAVLFGFKNQQLVNVNYFIAANEIRLSSLLAIIFFLGMILSIIFCAFFYLKLKIKNRSLRKVNKKQSEALTQLRLASNPVKD